MLIQNRLWLNVLQNKASLEIILQKNMKKHFSQFLQKLYRYWFIDENTI